LFLISSNLKNATVVPNRLVQVGKLNHISHSKMLIYSNLRNKNHIRSWYFG
jgi:hypothetical protein